jgi:hypothetical protein
LQGNMAMNLFSKAMVAGELFVKLSRNSTKRSLQLPELARLFVCFDHVVS